MSTSDIFNPLNLKKQTLQEDQKEKTNQEETKVDDDLWVISWKMLDNFYPSLRTEFQSFFVMEQ